MVNLIHDPLIKAGCGKTLSRCYALSVLENHQLATTNRQKSMVWHGKRITVTYNFASRVMRYSLASG